MLPEDYSSESRIGFKYRGSCLTGDVDYIYVTIPKNASSYTEDIWKLMINNAKPDNFLENPDLRNKKAIVVIRDPLERWMSGIVHNFYTRTTLDSGISLEDKTILKYIFVKLTLDEHSELQCNFLENLEINQCVFLRLGVNYSFWLKKVMVDLLGVNYSFWNKSLSNHGVLTMNTTGINYNHSDKNYIKQKNLKTLYEYYRTNPTAQEQLSKYLKRDYDFIAKLKFYDKKQSGL